MQGLIPSLTPFYNTFARLCDLSPQGAWHGDIFALRKAFHDSQLTGEHVTNRLTSLQKRGMLTFTVEKPRHKQCLWTVTVTSTNEHQY
jgi:hypothetical protein